jgi:hypothetical protein
VNADADLAMPDVSAAMDADNDQMVQEMEQ